MPNNQPDQRQNIELRSGDGIHQTLEALKQALRNRDVDTAYDLSLTIDDVLANGAEQAIEHAYIAHFHEKVTNLLEHDNIQSNKGEEQHHTKKKVRRSLTKMQDRLKKRQESFASSEEDIQPPFEITPNPSTSSSEREIPVRVFPQKSNKNPDFFDFENADFARELPPETQQREVQKITENKGAERPLTSLENKDLLTLLYDLCPHEYDQFLNFYTLARPNKHGINLTEISRHYPDAAKQWGIKNEGHLKRLQELVLNSPNLISFRADDAIQSLKLIFSHQKVTKENIKEALQKLNRDLKGIIQKLKLEESPDAKSYENKPALFLTQMFQEGVASAEFEELKAIFTAVSKDKPDHLKITPEHLKSLQKKLNEKGFKGLMDNKGFISAVASICRNEKLTQADVKQILAKKVKEINRIINEVTNGEIKNIRQIFLANPEKAALPNGQRTHTNEELGIVNNQPIKTVDEDTLASTVDSPANILQEKVNEPPVYTAEGPVDSNDTNIIDDSKITRELNVQELARERDYNKTQFHRKADKTTTKRHNTETITHNNVIDTTDTQGNAASTFPYDEGFYSTQKATEAARLKEKHEGLDNLLISEMTKEYVKDFQAMSRVLNVAYRQIQQDKFEQALNIIKNSSVFNNEKLLNKLKQMEAGNIEHMEKDVTKRLIDALKNEGGATTLRLLEVMLQHFKTAELRGTTPPPAETRNEIQNILQAYYSPLQEMFGSGESTTIETAPEVDEDTTATEVNTVVENRNDTLVDGMPTVVDDNANTIVDSPAHQTEINTIVDDRNDTIVDRDTGTDTLAGTAPVTQELRAATVENQETPPDEDNADTIVTQRNPEARQAVNAFISNLLLTPESMRPNDPAILAIENLYQEIGEDALASLTAFMKNPDLMGARADYATINGNYRELFPNKTIDAANASVPNLKGYLDDLEAEDEILKDSQRGAVRQDNEVKNRRILIRRTINELKSAIQIEGREKKYGSPREILATMLMFNNLSDKTYNVNKLIDEVNRRIGPYENYQENGYASFFNGIGRVGLKSCLNAIAKKDEYFAEWGENPEKHLEAFAGFMVANDIKKIKGLMKKLPGGLEKNLYTTIPRLIEYLKFALHHGLITGLKGNEAPRHLLQNLQRAREDFIRLEVNQEAEKNKWSIDQKMREFIMRMNRGTEHLHEIWEEQGVLQANPLRKHYWKNNLKRTGYGVGATAVATASIFAWPYVLGAGALGLMAKYRKETASAIKATYNAGKIVTNDILKPTAKFIGKVGVGTVKIAADTGYRTLKTTKWAAKRLLFPWTFLTDDKGLGHALSGRQAGASMSAPPKASSPTQ